MGILSNMSGRDIVKVFKEFGYTEDHQTGSHVILYHDTRATLSVPNHREIAPGLLRGLIRKSGISVDDFMKAR
ncbi:MAG: type II toxin-antitoxin system HicA family toxin [Nitrospirae bacterium]|nr:type II toxin-antitoxin system HicA family toxin [Nitrospirota bacterium]